MNYRSKNTKIVATISDLRCDVEFLQVLYDSGMDVVRLNTAHQDEEGAKKVIENVRKVSNKIPILLDTKGPEIRTRDVGEPIEVKKGQHIVLTGLDGIEAEVVIRVNYEDFAKDVPVDSVILLNDGDIRLFVKNKTEHLLECVVENDGIIKNKKTVNVPDVHLQLPSVTEKDRRFIEFAIEQNLDFIAHSFVRNKEDVKAVQEILDKHQSKIRIIAKIENRAGVENIEEIVDTCHGVMVARGDLGVEVPASEVPLMQKEIIQVTVAAEKPVIVATHMLESMIQHPRATRAEVSDVANAILDGASAVMLSAETASGEYPVESVRTMSEIALHLKKHKLRTNPVGVEPQITGDASFLATVAVDAALRLDCDAIVVPTVTGRTARIISSMRSRKPIYAPCYDETIMRQLGLSHGIRQGKLKNYATSDELVYKCAKYLVDHNELTQDSKVVVVAGTPGQKPNRTNFLEIAKLKDIIEEFESQN